MNNKNNLICLHADDLGRSREVNSSIFHSIDNGYVNGVSILVNNQYAYKAIKGAKKRGVKIRLHINLTEDTALFKNKKNSLITNNKNIFCKSFFSLLIAPLYLNFSKLKIEIKREIEEQIKLFLKVSNIKKIKVDGHQHIHCIPWVTNILISLKSKYNIEEIRVPDEKFYISNYKNIFKFWYLNNVIKFLLLKILSYTLRIKLKKHKIKFNDLFIGVLDTGHMSIDSIKKGLKKTFNNFQKASIEILIHPGKSKLSERKYWQVKSQHQFYINKERSEELMLSKNKHLKELLHYENFTNS